LRAIFSHLVTVGLSNRSAFSLRDKMDKVSKESSPEHLEPFKSKMTTFVEEASGRAAELEELVQQSTRVARFFSVKNTKTGKNIPNAYK
jgi:hypothetical protein